MMSVTCRLSGANIIYSYLEVIREVVLAVTGRTKKTLCLIARGRTLSVCGGRVGVVVVWVALRRSLVLGLGSHDVDKCAHNKRSFDWW
jgi:hypothetical protein